MYLKNTQTDKTAGIRTIDGFIILQPLEIIDLDVNKLYGRVPSCVVKSDKESFEKYTKHSKGTLVVKQEIKKEDNKKEDVKEEEMLDDSQIEVLVVQETKTEKEVLEEKIETLKKTWEITSRPKKKEQIQNEIKELQEKLEKLQ